MNVNGWNALHCAAMKDDVPTLERLLMKGIKISEKTNHGETALMIAIRKGNKVAAKYLALCVEGNNKSISKKKTSITFQLTNLMY